MFVFGKLNVDENPITANAFGIQSIPTITIFKNGELDGIVGPASNCQIQTKLLVQIQSRTDTNGPYSQNMSQDSRSLGVSGDRWAQSSLNDVVIFVGCETLDLTPAVCSNCVPDNLD
jgi:thioredoxin-like negative regulator of GroEL